MNSDPLMPQKVLEGREEEIRQCVAFNLCLAQLFRDAPMTCYINSVCAHEADPVFVDPSPAEEEKEVMIVGEKVVVWGNRKPGIGCALHLAKQGKKSLWSEKTKPPVLTSSPLSSGAI